MSSERLISGNAVRDKNTSLVSKSVRLPGPATIPNGLSRKVKVIIGGDTALNIPVSTKDSGTLYSLKITGSAISQLTLDDNLEPGSVFEFVVTEVGGTGSININLSGTGTTRNGYGSYTSAALAQAALSSIDNISTVAAKDTVGDRAKVTVVDSTNVIVEAYSTVADGFIFPGA